VITALLIVLACMLAGLAGFVLGVVLVARRATEAQEALRSARWRIRELERETYPFPSDQELRSR